MTRPSEGPLRLLRWVLGQLLPVWLCLVLGGVSAAAAADDSAPMCDPHGASVAAPTEVPEVDRGKLEELPCDALLLWMIGSGFDLSGFDAAAKARDGVPPPAPELQLQRTRPEGVMQPVVLLPARSDERRLPESDVVGLPARPGHRTPVFRPPVGARS